MQDLPENLKKITDLNLKIEAFKEMGLPDSAVIADSLESFVEELKSLKELYKEYKQSESESDNFDEKFDEIEKLLEKIVNALDVSYQKYTTDIALKLAVNIAGVQKGDKGDDYVLTEDDKNEIASKIKVPVVEKIIEKTEVIKEQPIVTNEIKEVAVADTPEQIIEKINSTENSIDKKVIIGLVDELNNLKNLISNIPRGGARKVPIIKRINISSQLDGVTKSFNLPKDTVDVLGVFGSQFPANFNPEVDWSFSGTTLTLADHIGAPESGQALYCLIETLFYGKV